MELSRVFEHPWALWICLALFAVLMELYIIWRITSRKGADSGNQASGRSEAHTQEVIEQLCNTVNNLEKVIEQNSATEREHFEELNKTVSLLDDRIEQNRNLAQKVRELEDVNTELLTKIDAMGTQVKELLENNAKLRKNPVLKVLNDLLNR